MNKLGQSNAFLELVFLFHLLSSGLLSRPSELPFDQGSCWELWMRVGEDLGEEELSLLRLIGVARSRSLGASCDWETGPLPESPRWDCPGH